MIVHTVFILCVPSLTRADRHFVYFAVPRKFERALCVRTKRKTTWLVLASAHVRKHSCVANNAHSVPARHTIANTRTCA